MSEKPFVYRGLECPVPIHEYPHILLAHGSGGKLTHQLIHKIFQPLFGNPDLDTENDSALLTVSTDQIAMTTDSYVIHPLFFPGGDIGTLAVYGTVNDLAMSGADPAYLSVAFILEEGLPVETLWKIAVHIKEAAERTGIRIVTGDTKVVDHGKGDQIFINTSGIGIIRDGIKFHPSRIERGDKIIVSGDLGRHGISILLSREGLDFHSQITSDLAPLHFVVKTLKESGITIHCLRDLTRGGLATALIELSQSCGYEFILDEKTIPVRDDVQTACEVLGLDPLYVANEGRMVCFAPPAEADRVVEIMRQFEDCSDAAVIGEVQEKRSGRVLLRTTTGTTRVLDMFVGEQLPRIC